MITTVLGVSLEFSTPFCEVKIKLKGKEGQIVGEMGLLDEGSEIVIIQQNLCEELSCEVNQG